MKKKSDIKLQQEKRGSLGSRIIALLVLHGSLLVYSASGILSKLAAQQAPLSVPFILYYAGVIAILGIYALVWQQIIKHLPLTTAFANKAITVVWGMLWGFLLFSESMNILKILGALMVTAGVVLFVIADKPSENEPHADDELLGEGL